MPIQRRNAATLSSVTRQIEDFERRYGIETDSFIARRGCVAEVDGEDGTEWLYLAEQLRVLREAAVECLYSSASQADLLQNDESSPELLAA